MLSCVFYRINIFCLVFISFQSTNCCHILIFKVEKILKCSLDSIPSSSVKIQIMGRKICLRCKGKTLMGIVNKLFVFKSSLTATSNVLPLCLKLSRPYFEFSLKMMGSNPSYLLKSFLLYKFDCRLKMSMF